MHGGVILGKSEWKTSINTKHLDTTMNKRQIASKLKQLTVNECGTCNLCCKLPAINDKGFEKNDYEWCKHCDIGKGCKVYKKRPDSCQGFMCLYSIGLMESMPSKVGFFAFIEHDLSLEHKVFTVYCEPENVGGLEMQIRNDPKLNKFLQDGWTFVARINKNQNERIIISNDR